MTRRALHWILLALSVALAVPAAAAESRRTLVVTSSVLGAVVAELAGDQLDVQVAIPNGMDPHEWEPSAKDVAKLARADLVVANGLHLEAGLERALAQARAAGVPVFVAMDAIEARRAGRGGADAPGHREAHRHPHAHGEALDPHFWTDPLAMKAVARALAAELRVRFGLDLADRLAALERRLDALDAEIRASVAAIPPARRTLVTGHESLGYFAARYGFRTIGAVVPGLSTQAESSARGLSELKRLIEREQVKVLFTEVGTPPRVTEALAKDAGVRCVPLTVHAVPADGSYVTFVRALARTIVESLR